MAELILLTAELLAEKNFQMIQEAVAANPQNAAADLEALAQENGYLNEVFDALKKEHEALAKINAELQAQIEAGPGAAVVVAKPTLSDKTFTHNKKEYGFVYPQLRFEGAIITADDVVKDKKLQEKLVEMESGFIKLV